MEKWNNHEMLVWCRYLRIVSKPASDQIQSVEHYRESVSAPGQHMPMLRVNMSGRHGHKSFKLFGILSETQQTTIYTWATLYGHGGGK